MLMSVEDQAYHSPAFGQERQASADELDDDDLDGGLNLSDEEGNARSHLRE